MSERESSQRERGARRVPRPAVTPAAVAEERAPSERESSQRERAPSEGSAGERPPRRMFLNGTAMSGQKDHGAVTGARLLGPCETAPRYRFVAVRDEFPGLLPVDEGGVSVPGELFEMPEEMLLGSLLPSEPAELELGTVELADGEVVNAMRLRADRLAPGDTVVDIADLGWRTYQAHLAAQRALPGRLERAAQSPPAASSPAQPPAQPPAQTPAQTPAQPPAQRPPTGSPPAAGSP